MTSPAEHPDDHLGGAAIALILGIKRSSWNSMVKNAQTPAPDGREPLSNWPWWYRSTIETWKATRPGRGFRRDLGAAGFKPDGRTAQERARRAARELDAAS